MPKKNPSIKKSETVKPLPKKPAKKIAAKKSATEAHDDALAPEASRVTTESPKPARPKPVKEMEAAIPEPQKPKAKAEKYFETIGRRKRARARVRLYTSSPNNSAEAGNLVINTRPYKEYFAVERYWLTVEDALKKLKSLNRFRATVQVEGGGLRAQSEAVRHGLSRALVKFDQNFRKRLKRAGFLKRDPREKERKKYGLKKARRRPQWAKR